MAAGLINSFPQIALIAVLGLGVSSTAAFARLRFSGRDVLFAVIVALVILPLAVLALPLLLTVTELGLTGGRTATLAGLTLPFAAKAFNITSCASTSWRFRASWKKRGDRRRVDIRPALVTVVLLDVPTHWSDFIGR
jgi:ABC-type spermidine/putrescine transport system permease subunit II